MVAAERLIVTHDMLLSLEPISNCPFCTILASGSNFNPRNIPDIPAVKISAFLDRSKIERFETGFLDLV
jgi:hypothetical protein